MSLLNSLSQNRKRRSIGQRLLKNLLKDEIFIAYSDNWVDK